MGLVNHTHTLFNTHKMFGLLLGISIQSWYQYGWRISTNDITLNYITLNYNLTDHLGLHQHISSHALCQIRCKLGWGTSTPTYNVNEIQFKPKVQKYKKKTNKKLVELSNRKRSKCGLHGGQKNPARKNPVGTNGQEIWVATGKAQALSD